MIHLNIKNFLEIFNNIIEAKQEFVVVATPLHPKIESLYVSFIEYACEMAFFDDIKVCVVSDHNFYVNLFKETATQFLEKQYGYSLEALGQNIKITNISEEDLSEEYFNLLIVTKEEEDINILRKLPSTEKCVFFCLNTQYSLFNKVDEDEVFAKIMLTLNEEDLQEIENLI